MLRMTGERDGALVAAQLRAFQLSDPVLGADAAVELVARCRVPRPRRRGPRARNCASSPPRATLRLKCRLPSPACPYVTRRASGTTASAAAEARATNAGRLATGTETSCLRLAPSRRCASGIDSRRRQSASRCGPEVANTASSNETVFAARARARARASARSDGSSRALDTSHSTYQACAPPSGSARRARARRRARRALRGSSSKVVTSSPLATRNRPSSCERPRRRRRLRRTRFRSCADAETA